MEDFSRTVIESIDRSDKYKRSIPLGGPEFYTNQELIKLITRTIGKKRIQIKQPIWAMKIVANVFNLLPKPLLTPATLELFDFDNVTSDSQIIEHEFGFKPVYLKDYLNKEGINIR